MCSNLSELTKWSCYPSYEQYVEIMQKFADKYPNLCKLEEFGQSLKGRKLLAVKISDKVNIKEEEPEVFYTSTMHGDETVGYILMLRLIHYLLTNYNKNSRITELVNNTEIWINPNANPDGTYKGGNHTVKSAVRNNSNNIDLNRNFPSVVKPNEKVYMQKENRQMADFMKKHNFSLSANFHCGSEVVNYPWDSWYYPRLHADNDWFYKISRQYVDTVHANSTADYMSCEDNGVTLGSEWYKIVKGRQDYVNYYLHGREVTIELSNIKNPPAKQLPQYWNYNYRSLLNYIENVHKGIKGRITNEKGKSLKAKIKILEHDKDSSEIYSNKETGWYYRMLSAGNYKLLFTCKGYEDFKVTTDLETDETKVINVVMKNTQTPNNKIRIEKISPLVYNNPVNNNLNISFFAKKSQNIKVMVYNILGVQLISNEYNVQIGRNDIELNFAKMKKGYYICRVKGDGVDRLFREFNIIKN